MRDKYRWAVVIKCCTCQVRNAHLHFSLSYRLVNARSVQFFLVCGPCWWHDRSAHGRYFVADHYYSNIVQFSQDAHPPISCSPFEWIGPWQITSLSPSPRLSLWIDRQMFPLGESLQTQHKISCGDPLPIDRNSHDQDKPFLHMCPGCQEHQMPASTFRMCPWIFRKQNAWLCHLSCLDGASSQYFCNTWRQYGMPNQLFYHLISSCLQ